MMRIKYMFCAALVLSGCAQTDSPPSDTRSVSALMYDENDAIPNDVPLPRPGINQRPYLGIKNVLVTVTNWQGENTLDKAKIEKHTLSTDNDSLRTYISVASKGKLTLNGRVVSYTSGPRPDGCKPSGTVNTIELARAEGLKAATANGIDPATVDYWINVIDCHGGASAYRPGNITGVYGQAESPHVYKHEFGHSLGYAHPETYSNCLSQHTTVWAPINCKRVAMGDTGDTVSGGAALYPVHNRWYSGWLDDSQIQIVNKTGKYLLAKAGSSPSPITPPQLILINRKTSPKQIALELREAGYMFDNFPPGDNRVTGVWVRFTDMWESLMNYQLDATPTTTSTTDPTLQTGQVLTDPDSKINVKMCGFAGTHASLAISLNNEPMPNCN